ncbi:hypothetical protein RhiirB3_453092 [Rhizophagus irregularis]|nr:hypothetical protein RhiirB3_453092 [Rhizophagus irregularis]
MENKIFNHSTIRKRKPRENETSEHHQECILASEINQQCERRLENNRYIRTIKWQQFQALESQQDQINDLEILKVHRAKVAHALCWLKENNRYYKDMIIIIDNEFLQSLFVDGSIDDQNTQIVAEDLDHDEEDM